MEKIYQPFHRSIAGLIGTLTTDPSDLTRADVCRQLLGRTEIPASGIDDVIQEIDDKIKVLRLCSDASAQRLIEVLYRARRAALTQTQRRAGGRTGARSQQCLMI